MLLFLEQQDGKPIILNTNKVIAGEPHIEGGKIKGTKFSYEMREGSIAHIYVKETVQLLHKIHNKENKVVNDA